MGQHPKVIAGDAGRDRRLRHRRRRHPQHLGHQPLSRRAGGGTRRPARQGRALLFTSGYVSNWAALSTLGSRSCKNCVILSDALNHASMIEGIRHSRADKVIWKHNDPKTSTGSWRPSARPGRRSWPSKASIRWMATSPDRRDLRRLREAWRAQLSRRGARGRAVRPARRRRCRTRRADADQIDMIEGTLGKAYGCMGGYITGSKVLCDFVRSFCERVHLHHRAAARRGRRCRRLDPHLKESDVERQQQRRQVARLRARLDEHGIPHLPNPSHIIPVMIKDPVKCRQISDILMADHGHLCAADQLSDRAEGHRAAAHHALAAAHRRGYRPSGHGAQRALATLRRWSARWPIGVAVSDLTSWP
jgi:hypothetical protein